MKEKSASRRKVVMIVSMFLLPALLSGMFWDVTAGETDEYNPQEAGHPLKLMAYLAFPIGVLFDYALMRPGFWLVQKEPMATIFGYDYMSQDEGEATPRTVEGVLDEEQGY